MNNLRIYEAARSVPPEAQKAFNNGRFSGTDINPMWRIKKLTELYGPAGIGWYTDILSERSERLTEDTVIAVVDLNLYVKDNGEWSKPIYGTGGNKLVSKTRNGTDVSDEGYKMAYTDALSVACKALGIGADVYYSKDKTKYTASQANTEAKPAAPETPPEEPLPWEKPTNGPRMAEEWQIKFLRENASEEQYMWLMNKYGPDLSRLTYAAADNHMAKLKNRGAK